MKKILVTAEIRKYATIEIYNQDTDKSLVDWS